MTNQIENSPEMNLLGQKVYFSTSENMNEVKSDSIDVIVTSPPYNRGKKYSDTDGNEYDDNLPEEEYFALLTRVWKECFRVLSIKGAFFLNIGDSAQDQGKSEKVVALAEKVGFVRIQTIIWIKSLLGRGHYTPSGGDKRLNNVWEHIYMLVKNKKEYEIYPKDIGVPYADKSNIGRYGENDLRDAGNIWFIPYSKTTGATIKKGHDAPFPVELAIKCIQLTRAKTILDPFLGTGASLSAAVYMNISGIGYEKYPRKDLIQEVISSKSEKLPQNMNNDSILLPHLDLLIEFLVTNLIEFKKQDPKLKIKIKNSKKAQEEYNIIIDLLKKKNLFDKISNLLID